MALVSLVKQVEYPALSTLLRPVARGAALPLETRQAALKVAAGTAELPGC